MDCIYAEKENLMEEVKRSWFKYKGWLNRLQVKTSQVL